MSEDPNYAFEALLAAEVRGELWRARRPDGTEVAVRRVPAPADRAADALRRRQIEIRALTALRHPHVMALLDVFEDGGELALVMQPPGGGRLVELLTDGPLPPERVVVVATQLAAALDAAHRRGIVHGHVSPTAVGFSSDGGALLEFGPLGSPAGGEALHRLAPEVLAGHPPTERSDVYALAVLCFEALTGSCPAPPHRVPRGQQAFGRLRALAPWVEPGLAGVVERAMHPEPAHRPAHAARLATELSAAMQRTGRHATPGPAPPAQIAGRPVPAAANPTEAVLPADDGGAAPAGPAAHEPAQAARPQPASPPGRQRSRHRHVVFVVGMAVLGATAALLVPGLWRQGPPATETAEPAPPDAEGRDGAPHGSQVRCASLPAPPLARASTLWADVDGDGCLDAVRWEDGILAISAPVGASRFSVGQSGDVPLVGDWNCDGVATLALYRPDAGHLFTFTAWPAEGSEVRASAETGHPPDGTPRVRVSPQTGCAVVEVVAPDS